MKGVFFKSLWLVFWESLQSFQRNRGFQKAAMLAYFSFLGMIPLLLLVTLLLGRFLAASHEAWRGLEEALSRLSPFISGVALNEVKALAHNRTWSLVSLLLLFWAVTPLAAALRSEFAVIFRLDQPASFWLTKLRDIGGVLLVVFLLITLAAGNLIRSLLPTGLAQLPRDARLTNVIGPAAVALVVFMLLFLILIPLRLRWWQLALGALVTVVLLELVGPVFTIILKVNPDYGLTFGSLKTIFLLLVWVYYSFAVILFGAEVMANLWRKDALILRRLFTTGSVSAKNRALLNPFLRTVPENEWIFREGDPGQEMFYILNGAVALNKGGRDFMVMRPGRYFGEMAMLLGVPRTSGARTVAPDTELAVVARKNFDTVLRENPGIMFTLLREMADRLKAATAAAQTPADARRQTYSWEEHSS